MQEGTQATTTLAAGRAGTRTGPRIGQRTIAFSSRPRIAATAAVGGPMEGDGPLGRLLDVVYQDSLLGEKSWELAETRMLCEAVELAADKAGLAVGDVDMLVAGDLLNEIIASSFAARHLDIPFLGIFGACSALTEAIGIAAMAVDGGYARRAIAAVCSHHDTAERQYRYPTELAVQRPPTAQWTVTGAGAVVITAGDNDGDTGGSGEYRGDDDARPRITHATFGRVVDMGIKNPFDLGSAMAPAAADTIRRHLADLQVGPDHYDLILTGDLSRVGLPIAMELLAEDGLDVSGVMDDCGLRVYHPEQEVGAGASGCASSALVFAAQVFRDLQEGRIGRLLLVSTGALLSKTSAHQGENIPGIAHAIAMEAPGAGKERGR